MRAHLFSAVAASLLLLGCSKDTVPSIPAPDAVASSTPPPGASTVPATSAVISATALASTPPPTTNDAATHAGPKAPEAKPHPTAAQVTGNHFTLDVASAGCIAGTACAVTLRLEATGGYHINQEYPYKVTIEAMPSVAFLSKDGTGVFSKAANDFRIDSEHVATMTVRIRPAAKGTVAIAGEYKMSVCSEANCQIEQTRIALAVPVM